MDLLELTVCLINLVVAVFGATIQMLFGLVLTWVLITLTFIDFDTQLLPDRFTLPLAALGLGINSFAIYTTATSAIWGLFDWFPLSMGGLLSLNW